MLLCLALPCEAQPDAKQLYDRAQLENQTKFVRIADGLQHPEFCLHLDLSYHEMWALDSTVGLLPFTQYLNLSYNNLKTLPGELGDVTQLQYLFAQKNYIETLPYGICRLRYLREVDLSDNQLLRLPHCVNGLSLIHI